MFAIQAVAIDKRFGGVHALRQVSLEVKHGEILGLVGHNGAGKTTLIRILTGDLHADEGQIIMDGQAVQFGSVRDAMARGVGVVRQDLNLVPELSLAENLFLGSESAFVRRGLLDRRAMGTAARPLLDRVGITQNSSARLGSLPVGDQQLVAAARALRTAGHVLFLDEPTSSLSPWEAERLFAQVRLLASQGVAIVYISHRLDEVVAICHRVVVLRDGMVAGNFEKPADKLAAIIDTMAPGGAAPTSRDTRPRGPALLEVRDLVTGRFGPATFTVHRSEVLGLFGLVGAGRTEIARALIGDLPAAGDVKLRGQSIHLNSPWHGYAAGVAYLSENRKAESIFTGQHVRANITVRAPQGTANRGWLRQVRLQELTSSISDKLDIRPRNQTLPIEALSGGNQQKAALGRLLADALDVFILDEPTHGIDVTAKRDLLRLLNELAGQGKGVIFISSEIPELLAVSDRVLVLRRGQVVGEFNPATAHERELLGAASGENAHRSSQSMLEVANG